MIWKENLKNGQNVLEKWHNVVMRYYSHLFQMPPKKVKHGGARVDAGRKSLTGEYGNDKTMEEKKKADRNRKAKDRGQLKVPEARSVVESGDDGKDRESVRIGWPQLRCLPSRDQQDSRFSRIFFLFTSLSRSRAVSISLSLLEKSEGILFSTFHFSKKVKAIPIPLFSRE